MFRRLDDFADTWKFEAKSTLRVMRALTDASLATTVGSDNRTLGRVAWHITGTLGEMMGLVGLTVNAPHHESPPPASAEAIASAYETGARSLGEEVAKHWTDALLETENPMYGFVWKKGVTLYALVSHQAHHRGQMTVLMRHAGLRVPGVAGPAREDWASMGMEAPQV